MKEKNVDIAAKTVTVQFSIKYPKEKGGSVAFNTKTVFDFKNCSEKQIWSMAASTAVINYQKQIRDNELSLEKVVGKIVDVGASLKPEAMSTIEKVNTLCRTLTQEEIVEFVKGQNKKLGIEIIDDDENSDEEGN